MSMSMSMPEVDWIMSKTEEKEDWKHFNLSFLIEQFSLFN